LHFSPEREFEWQAGEVLDVSGKELMTPLAMLRRPFSLAGRRDTKTGVELEILHRVVGIGTNWLSQVKPGMQVNVIGPLGNHFELPGENTTAILVGGGVGIPPMIYLAEKLAGRKAVVFCGALTRDLLPLNIVGEASSVGDAKLCIGEFAKHQVPAVVTTDDGSFGFKGLITQALERYLDSVLSPQSSALIYTCGPEGMMKRVGEIAAARKIPCQISVERAMACGMGTCQSCVIRVKDATASNGWRYRLACTDGPVFAQDALMW
jgi:dihydroorotate dehydrogenase electron transfer subunit